MKSLQILFAILSGLGIAACSAPGLDHHAGREPSLSPEAFFDGDLSAHGVIKNRGGKVIRHFNATIEASWEDGVGTLDEHFVFDDGERQRRVWTLEPAGEGRYRGSAGDVVGPAHITVTGNAMHLDYVLQVPWRDDTIDLRIDDRMYLVSPDVMLNESRMTKFGFEVGQILLTIVRQGAAQ
jgi:hypothetical protein